MKFKCTKAGGCWRKDVDSISRLLCLLEEETLEPLNKSSSELSGLSIARQCKLHCITVTVTAWFMSEIGLNDSFLRPNFDHTKAALFFSFFTMTHSLPPDDSSARKLDIHNFDRLESSVWTYNSINLLMMFLIKIV